MEVTGLFFKGEKFFIGLCPEVPGANGQGISLDECRDSLKEAVKLVLEDQAEDLLMF